MQKGFFNWIGLLAGVPAFLALPGCQRVLTLSETRAYYAGSAWKQEIETQNHLVRLRYIPKTLQLVNSVNLDSNRVLTESLMDSLSDLSTNRFGICFAMEIAPKNIHDTPGFDNDVVFGTISGQSDYRRTLDHYLFGLREKIWLEADGKRVPLSTYNMENSWGMSPNRFFLISFDETNLKRWYGDGWAGRPWAIVLDDFVPGLGRKKLNLVFAKGDV